MEYSRLGNIIKGQERAVVKSRYEEDVHPNNHSVSGEGERGRRGRVCVSVVPCCVSSCCCRVCGAPTGRLVAGASLAATPSSREPTALERLGKWPKGYAIA